MTRPRYHAFISYSHAADGALAPALQRGLQQLGRPWRQRRAMEVFRDETGLAVDPDLWGAIATALDGADWFVLLASPGAAASHWVGQEIEHCLATKGTGRMLVVLTEGTLRWDPEIGDFSADSDAAHPRLRGVFDTEPLVVDVSWARQETDLTLENAQFRADVARIAALIRQRPVQAVVADDARERRRTRTALGAALGALATVTVVAVVAAALAGISWRSATAERATAEQSARVALARELGSHARVAEDPRTALALAVEAYTLAPEPEHAGALLDAVAGAGSPLVTVPALLPDGYAAADIRSSSGSRDGAGGRLAVATEHGSVILDVATGQEWPLAGEAPHLTPDGEHAIGADGTILALREDGTVEPVAHVPSLDGEPSFTADGSAFAYRHAGSSGARLTVAAITGEDVRSVPVPLGSDCSGCGGDASWFAIAPDGSHVAARIGPVASSSAVVAELRSYAVEGDGLRPLATEVLGGTGVVRFSDDSSAIWASDGGTVVVLDPVTLVPVSEPMSIDRSGALLFADDTRALAVDNCLPGVVLPPTMATVAELVTEIEFTEGGCVDPAPRGGEPRWLLDGAWVRTSLGAWPTDPQRLLDIACAALGGPMSAAEFTDVSGVEHGPLGCAEPVAES